MENLINQLPDNCLEHIFSFLPIEERLRVERVCQRWHNIGERGWPDKTGVWISVRYSDNMIHSILKRCGRFLRELTISLSSEHPQCLPLVIQFCRLEQLERLCIYRKSHLAEGQEELEIYHLKAILERAANLVDLSIYEDLQISEIDYLDSVNRATLQKLTIMNEGERVSFNPDRFPNLRELTLRGIVINDIAMNREEESLRRLEKIDISHCHIQMNFTARIQSFTNLQKLCLVNNTYYEMDISEKYRLCLRHIREITTCCDEIKELTLIGFPILTSNYFQHLGEMPSLEVLRLGSFYCVNNRDLLHLKNVRKLIFEDVPAIIRDDGLIQLITNSSKLEELKLSHISGLDMTFINDVKLIFDRGLRQKHLHFEAWMSYSDKLVHRTFPIVIDEPLLSLRLYLHERK